ncbi:MAG: DNA polymerase III subunit delta' [Proteobacteria bacterium]|nr:DNA polymerase III subunit delta' [Pseudomonadota bacterium]
MSETSSICFTGLFGQEKAKHLFSRSLMASRVPHAYIFRGPDGVGKRLFAQGVAAAINCRERRGAVACGNCSSCRKFRSKSHPDFLLIQPVKGVIKIEQIRQLAKELSYPPFESEMRIVVLEDVHTMRREAANSLLKMLEEPPPNNLLILTAESSQEILSTLTSRCQVLPFSRLSASDTTAILAAHGVEPEAALLLARLSEGSPGRAMLFQKSEMVMIWREVVSVLSDPSLLPDRDVGILLRLAEKMAAQKDDLPSFLSLLKIWIRDLLLPVSTTGEAVKDDFRLRKSWSSAELFAKLQAISRAEQELARNCNRNLVCEVLLFALQ